MKIKCFFLIILLFIGFFAVYLSSQISDYIPFGLYNFGFELRTEPDDQVYLNEFNLYYDFTEGQGNFSFIIYENKNIKEIVVEIPSIIEDYSLSSKICDEFYCQIDSPILFSNWSYSRYDDGSNRNITLIHFVDFSRSINNEKILINFKIKNSPYTILHRKFYNILYFNKLNIYPKGIFYFSKESYDTLYISGNKGGNIHLNLGEDYRCFTDCVYNLENIDKYYLSSDRDIKLEFIKEDNKDQA